MPDVPRYSTDTGNPILGDGGHPVTDCDCCDGTTPPCDECSGYPCPHFPLCAPCSITATFTDLDEPLCGDIVETRDDGTQSISRIAVTFDTTDPVCCTRLEGGDGGGLCTWSGNLPGTFAQFDGDCGTPTFTSNDGFEVLIIVGPQTFQIGDTPASHGSISYNGVSIYVNAGAPDSVSYRGWVVFNGAEITVTNAGPQFPMTISNNLNAARLPAVLYTGGSVDLALDCCDDCNACPEVEVVDGTEGDVTLGCLLCCPHLTVALTGAGCMSGNYDLYHNQDCTWSDNCGEALLTCDTDTWTLAITDAAGRCGTAGNYINGTFTAPFCPEFVGDGATITVGHNDFGGTPSLRLFSCNSNLATACPSNCECCCDTYTFHVSGLKCGNGTYVVTKAGNSCFWTGDNGDAAWVGELSCDTATGTARWQFKIIDTAAVCGTVNAYALWSAPVGSCRDAGTPLLVGPLVDNKCPPTKVDPLHSLCGWVLNVNQLAAPGITPSLSVEKSDCDTIAVVSPCPSDCSECPTTYAVALFVDAVETDFTVTRSGCVWSDPAGGDSAQISCSGTTWTVLISIIATGCTYTFIADNTTGCPATSYTLDSAIGDACGSTVTVTVS